MALGCISGRAFLQRSGSVIFVTVGYQMPFDRMIRLLDQWAENHPQHEIFAQIGKGTYHPQSFLWEEYLSPKEFKIRMQQADIIIAHAGMGSIITALECCKPILVFPRRAALNETRSDHQVDTATELMKMNRVAAAFTDDEFLTSLDNLDALAASERITHHASDELIEAVRTFIEHGDTA